MLIKDKIIILKTSKTKKKNFYNKFFKQSHFLDGT